MTTTLSDRILDEALPGVQLPEYDRATLTAGIVHFGVGGFHRAHQALVIDDLLRRGEARDWAICGAGVLPGDAHMRDVLRAQDGLYTFVQKHPDGHREARVVGSIIDYRYGPDDPEDLLEKLADPSTRIVSLTITEGGYNFDQVTGEFDLAQPDVAADLAPGAVPRTVFGYIVEALARRRERGITPFTLMSCDNIQGNGHMAQEVLTAFATARDPELGRHVHDDVSYPNSMVDRITPVTTDDDRAIVREEFGIDDGWPVVAEPFFQWVLEDAFVDGRPPYEHAGVQVVADVAPYERMKLRLLNASHQGMAYFGYLAGYRYAHEATADPDIATFLREYMDEEATATLLPVPGIDLDDYKATLIERFRNPAIRDTLARLCAESSDRIPKWLLPVVRERLAAGESVDRSAAIVASWARYAEGVDEEGRPIEVVDRLADELVPLARTQLDDPTAFIRNRILFGDLADDERFVSAYLAALDSLHARGARATVAELAERGRITDASH